MATTFSGIASGIDSAALIQSMLTVARQPITRLQAKQTANNTMSRKFTDIKTKMAALQTAAKGLDTRSEAMVNKPTSSNDKIATVTSAGGGTLGKFDITVTSVAKAHRSYSDGFSASNQSGLFPMGDLTLQVGSGTPVTLQIAPGDTLSSIAGKINTANLGVTAGLMFDGSEYRLQIAGSETGTNKAVSFSGAGATGLGLDKTDIQHLVQPAENAVIEIDGMTVTSQSNAISTAIPGVTLNVVDEGATSIVIDRDPDGLKTKLDTFVKAYNDVMTAMNAEFASVGGTQKAAGTLSGDSTLRSAQSSLRSMMTQSLSGLNSSFPSIGAMGITVGRDGTLSVDSEKLKTAVNKDYESVTSVLSGLGSEKGLMAQVVDKLDPLLRSDGTFTNRISSISTRNRDIDSQISRLQVRLDKYEESLQRQFASLESLMGGLQSQSAALSSIINSSAM
jgi:flagellar hook-associated protein 2